MFSYRTILSSIALAGVVTFTSWYSIRSSEEGIIRNPTSVVADGIASDIHLQQYSLKGILAYEGNATSAIQYSDQTVTLMNTNGIYYTTPPQPVWHAKADQTKVSADGKTIELRGHVQLSRPTEPNFPPLQMTTTQLFLYPSTNSAYTKAPVTLSEPGTQNITHAVGLRASETPQVITLLSKVNSTYEPSTHIHQLFTAKPNTGS
jgi:LPS export ABC transporter protein LptC